ncbi:MAG: sigma-54 factor interaction domain-containing protein, partial [Gemmatimonadota bacterium]|nr:sigma-54 factor interaction domain-containing protein [Gemmatimonadota bacterium]
MPPRLLVIACSDAFGRLWPEIAERAGLELVVADDPASAPVSPSVTLLACGGVEERAIDRLLETQRAGIEAPLIVGAEPDHRLAVQLMRAGAGAYFALPGDADRLEAELARAGEDRREVPTRDDGDYDFSALIGRHPSLAAALERAARVIPGGRATVLIQGETGTGKELIARAIHDNGPRARKPFVAVNCSAIPGTLLESELFGHEKGAFTDAGTTKPGLFELADGGTAFLDEISAMPIELQGKLLRFLETRELRRVGGIRTTSVDVRILAAANEDLAALAARKAFR